MKAFLTKIILFFVIVTVLDVLFGVACQYMNDHSKGGGIKSRHYVCKESNEELLIFGSSRAKHHYVPEIFEDSLHVTCYNTGEDGNGIILCFGLLKMITARYSPKFIIYDVTAFDITEDDNMKYLDLLKPYYYEPGVDSIFWSVNPKTRYMMLSNFYRYNTTCLRVLGNYVHPMNNYPKGYCALHKTMDYEPIIKDPEPGSVDSLKIMYFERFIELTRSRNIQLICCVSPIYLAPEDDSFYEPVKILCEKYDVPFLYYGSVNDMTDNKSFFEDRIHLNDMGARYFSQKMSMMIKNQETWTTNIDSISGN